LISEDGFVLVRMVHPRRHGPPSSAKSALVCFTFDIVASPMAWIYKCLARQDMGDDQIS
jgi:hypothetical protein